MTIFELKSRITSGELDDQLKKLYGSSERNIMKNRARYLSAAENFSRLYPECDEIRVFSVGGAVEISGCGTEYQNGKILAASVDADVIAIAALNKENKINFAFEKSEAFSIDTENLNESEKDEKASAVTEIIRRFEEKEIVCSGFDVYISSEIPDIAGASAAFEIVTAMMINSFFGDDRLGSLDLAEIVNKFELNSRYIDRAVCAGGGFLLADFVGLSVKELKKIGFDFSGTGYSLCITSTGSTAAGIEYKNESEKMSFIAKKLGGNTLGDIDYDFFYENIYSLREKFGDRDILNAVYFFDEERFVAEEAESLENGDTESFFDFVRRSGESAVQFWQNFCCSSDRYVQSLLLANAVSRKFLDGSGAVRIHKNGTGAFVIAFVPSFFVDEYVADMDRVFGKSSCQQFNIRDTGCYELE